MLSGRKIIKVKHEIKRISRIIDELTTFFLKEDTDKIEIRVEKSENKTVISIVDHDTCFDETYIEKMADVLKRERQREVEEYYWQLVGEMDEDYELLLVGVMTDEVEIKKIKGNLHIELVRYK